MLRVHLSRVPMPGIRCGVKLKIIFRDAGQFHQVPEQTRFERLIAVNRNRQPNVAPSFPSSFLMDVMAALHAQQ